jgi:hypothetical protein
MTPAEYLISGALTMGYALAAVFFLRFWRDTRDSLFAYFAAAFLLLAVGRLALSIVEPHEVLYLLRLAAFVLIIVAIAMKNRRS